MATEKPNLEKISPQFLESLQPETRRVIEALTYEKVTFGDPWGRGKRYNTYWANTDLTDIIIKAVSGSGQSV